MNHNDEEERNVFDLLRGTYRRVFGEMRGEPGSATRMWLVRALVLLVVLACGGGILWNALKSMPTTLIMIIVMLLGLRVAGWLWRRSRR